MKVPFQSAETAPLDPLSERIQRAVERLETAGEISAEEWGGPPPRLNGYCARSCRAYHLLTKHWPEARAEARYPDATIRCSPGDSDEAHYWLELPDRRILDLNHAPGDKPGRASQYRRSESGMRFRRKPGDGRFPARADAQKIMRAALQELGVDPDRPR